MVTRPHWKTWSAALGLAGACLVATATSAGIYRWTDDAGRIHYSDAPPGERAAGARAIALPPPPTPRPERAGVARERVILYSAAWCGYCKRARAHLQRRAVPFEEQDVETSEAGRRAFRDLGGRGVPILLVGRQRMDGYDAAGLDAMLDRAGHR